MSSQELRPPTEPPESQNSEHQPDAAEEVKGQMLPPPPPTLPPSPPSTTATSSSVPTSSSSDPSHPTQEETSTITTNGTNPSKSFHPSSPPPLLTALETEHATLIATFPLPASASATQTAAQRADHALTSARAVIQSHIALLHRYNEIKDVGMGLLGLLAEGRGCRVRDLMEEFGLGEGD